ncbi:MAG: hypothetical protein IAF38_06255 [Bacteroidia bacterium]|nr:hypothetical protein [Bacteroidia bacterium]
MEGEKNWKPSDLILQKNFSSFYGYEGYDSTKDLLHGSYTDSLKWLENKNWELRTFYKFPPNQVLTKHLDLYFERLDPYAEIYVNNNLLYKNQNYFISKTLPIEQFCNIKDSNEIRIVFPSLTKAALKEFEYDKMKHPADNEEGATKTSQFVRKPAYQFGWDISPRFLNNGIGGNVYITDWSYFKVTEASLKQDSLKKEKADLTATFIIEADSEMDVEVNTFDFTKNFKDSVIHFKKGMNNFSFTGYIKNPELWWPNGIYQQLGQKSPSLYGITFYFTLTKNKKYLYSQSVHQKTGLRKLKLVREENSLGESFYFEVNGKALFIKGTNYVPDINTEDYCYHANHTSSERLMGNALTDLEHSDYNMVRIWGGGDYPTECMLNFCDQHGILIWQDFMFSGNMYPDDEKFLNNVKEEAEFQVKRMRSHPCLALWCGNNEIDVAWKNWGWQKKYNYSVGDSLNLINTYQKIFYGILPNAIREFDPAASYIPSSPISNWGKKEEFTRGDNHYWGVWHGELPFETYLDHVPRFMSEYGFPSFPSLHIVKKYFSAKTLSLNDPAIKFRMKSYKGNELIEKYMKEYYGEARDFESFILLSQLLQAYAYKSAIEAHRRAKPYCMGTLYWQQKDSWPSVCWSTIDYDGNYKAAQFAVNNAYKPIILSAVKERENTSVFIISDLIKDTTLKIQISLIDFYGKQIFDTVFTKLIKENSSEKIFTKQSKNLLNGNDEKSVFLKMKIIFKKESYENTFYFARTKELNLPPPLFTKKINWKNRELVLKSSVLVKDVYVNGENNHGEDFSIEFFDLLPGEEKRIHWSEKNLPKIKILSFFDLIKK